MDQIILYVAYYVSRNLIWYKILLYIGTDRYFKPIHNAHPPPLSVNKGIAQLIIQIIYPKWCRYELNLEPSFW